MGSQHFTHSICVRIGYEKEFDRFPLYILIPNAHHGLVDTTMVTEWSLPDHKRANEGFFRASSYHDGYKVPNTIPFLPVSP